MRLCSWNSRALLGGHRDVATRRARRRLVGKLAERHDTVALQEVRGGASDAALFADEMREHVIYFSNGVGRGGGVMLLVKKRFLSHSSWWAMAALLLVTITISLFLLFRPPATNNTGIRTMMTGVKLNGNAARSFIFNNKNPEMTIFWIEQTN